MQKSDIINAFAELGTALKQIPEELVAKAGIMNPWFTPDFIRLAGHNWSQALTKEKIAIWLESESCETTDKKAGIIMAGNIPLVGLHDLLSVIAAGMQARIKLSAGDEVLMKFAIGVLCKALPELNERISTDGKLNGIDRLIATGSNNSARYFEYYFKDVPALIRKNRTSLAVLSGAEDDETLGLLANDIFTYFGMGCRNVSHLLLPRSIDYKRLYESYDKYMDHVNHHKYYNNYMYHKSILLMNLSKHYDNGFMLFQEKDELHAPVATLNYHFYDNLSEAVAYIEQRKDELQCVVSDMPEMPSALPFGSTQSPGLLDYADNTNVLTFLKTGTNSAAL